MGPPYLNKSDGNQEREIVMYAGSPMVYQFPSVGDPDDDSYEKPDINIGATLVFASLVNKTIIMFAPEESDVGIYKMKVVLEDRNPYYVLRDTIFYSVIVLSAKENTYKELLEEYDILTILIKSNSERIRFVRPKVDS
jgi:hypothetical protein